MITTTIAAALSLVILSAEPPASPAGQPTTENQVTTSLDRLVMPDSPLKDGMKIVFFGDSITEAGGYIQILRQRLDEARPGHGIRLVNRGHSGYRVPMIQPLLQAEVLDEQPDAVVIYIGINDVWHHDKGKGTTEADYESGLRDLLNRCKSAGVPVVLCSPSIIGEMPRGSNPKDEMLDRYAAISRRVAAEEGAVFCDLRAAFFGYLTEHKKDRSNAGVLTNDGVHMLPAGDALLIETMSGPVLTAMGG